jgi:anti-sigma factor RsiW
MSFTCDHARTLISSYLDGELSEAQATPLRRHLLDCQPCRSSVQSQKAFKRWFVDAEPVAVPAGFAARVARRARAGDTGTPVLEPGTGGVAPLRPGSAFEAERLRRFVLGLTAAAALLVVFLSLGLRALTLPGSDRLMADDRTPLELERALEELERLEREEGRDPSARAPRLEVGTPPAGETSAPR